MNTDAGTAGVSHIDAYRRRNSPIEPEAVLAEVIRVQSDIVGAGLDPQKVIAVIMAKAMSLTHSDGAVVEMRDGDSMFYWAATGCLSELRGARLSPSHSLSGTCLNLDTVLTCNDTERDSRVDRDACRRAGIRSMVVTPLRYAGTPIGVLKVVSPWVDAYGAEDVRVLTLLKDLISASIAHAASHADAIAEGNQAVACAAFELDARHARVKRALQNEAFELAFQPVVDLESGRVVGHEALARFSELPYRPPNEWFDDAKEAGLALELDLLVVRRALSSLAILPADTYVAINVSPDTAQNEKLWAMCSSSMSNRIVLELTEHATVADYGVLVEATNRLKRCGVRIAIDDAGAGFASLRHILRLQPALIKLDRSLIHGIEAVPDYQSMVAALLMFASGTGAEIVAEGIETEAELRALVSLGVRLGQGYFLGTPSAPDKSQAAEWNHIQG
jgi:EAL domain-containing protein (putative c-di-GMP-specific phosphodiesterase class I)